MKARLKWAWRLCGGLVLAVVIGVGVRSHLSFRDAVSSTVCFKNVWRLQIFLGDYAAENGIPEAKLYETAGNYITNRTLMLEHTKIYPWRFFRDPAFPACEKSPKSEIMSYEGRLQPPVNPAKPYLVLWEKKPYHWKWGQRNVLMSTGKIELLTEEDFQRLMKEQPAGTPSG